ncbi:hypothetical protein [Adlercreutzia sp. ZJ242]|uniref:hypothetical protein n=1 Tax=Adlercreutzia sp. ZJ242 TaxID=2709409 RepID=UPI0013EE1136|nr:hypothetical protein [Adlercreutzia sp. ZJ242]
MSMRLEARVDVAEALSYLGHAGQDLGPDLAARLERAAALCEGMAPSGMARAFPLESFACDEQGAPCGVRLRGCALELEGYDVAHHLAGACEVVLMAVTLGLGSESILRREAALNPTDGLLVDACASALVEDAANELSRLVEERARMRGLRAGARFSPGYGDLPLGIQRAFLDALGAGRALGISVTRGDLLVPAKSITAVAGLYCADAAGGPRGEGVPRDSAEPEPESAGCAEGAPRAFAPPEGGPAVPVPSARSCATCRLAPVCTLHAQGRTCHGR